MTEPTGGCRGRRVLGHGRLCLGCTQRGRSTGLAPGCSVLRIRFEKKHEDSPFALRCVGGPPHYVNPLRGNRDPAPRPCSCRLTGSPSPDRQPSEPALWRSGKAVKAGGGPFLRTRNGGHGRACVPRSPHRARLGFHSSAENVSIRNTGGKHQTASWQNRTNRRGS